MSAYEPGQSGQARPSDALVEKLRHIASNPAPWRRQYVKDRLLEAADEIERLRAAPKWRTMESAPKDGTTVLAWNGECQFCLAWSHASRSGGCWIVQAAGEGAIAQTYENGDRDYLELDYFWGSASPTHWQPLPPPPAI